MTGPVRNSFSLIILLSIIISGCAGSKYYMIRHEPLFSREEKYGKENVQLIEKKYDTGKETTEESLDISSLTRITNNEDMVEILSLNLSPDNQTLIFQAYKSETAYINIWSIRALDGKGLRFITNAESNDYNPCFTPDGNFIVFASGRTGTTKLWKVKKSGAGGFIQLTSGPSIDIQPDVSPDGKKIVFASISPVLKAPHIWVMNSDGTDLTELSEGFYPKWTSDGKKIVFISTAEIDKKPVRQLWVMNSDGTYTTQIMNILEGDCMSFSISPDGKKIAFSSNMNIAGVKQEKITNNNYDIWLVNIDGADLTQLTTNKAYDGDPVWSADSKFIYFCSNRGMRWDIWRILVPKSTENVEQQITSKETFLKKQETTIEIVTIPAPVIIEEPQAKSAEGIVDVEQKVEVIEQTVPTVKQEVKKETKKVTPKKTRTYKPKKPLSPKNVVSKPGGGLVILTWEGVEQKRKTGYFIYRTKTSGKDYKRVNKNPFYGLRFVDPEVENGIHYYFVITAVDRRTNAESNYSAEVTALPEHSSILKAREEAIKKKK